MEKRKDLTFPEAYAAMKDGKKIARKSFAGYWFIDQETGTFKIHLPERDGKPSTNITYGRLDVAVKNTLSNDWYILEEKTIVKAKVVISENDKNLTIVNVEETDEIISDTDLEKNMSENLKITSDIPGEHVVCNVYGLYVPNVEELDTGDCETTAYIKIDKSEISDLSVLKNAYI